MAGNETITVQVLVNCGVERAWEAFTHPDAVTRWNFASDDWHCPRAMNDLRTGGAFNYRMEARDGSVGFDFEGRYTEVCPLQRIRYTMGDERNVVVEFHHEDGKTRVIETFVPETTFPLEQQRNGWQAILDNYKKVAEAGA